MAKWNDTSLSSDERASALLADMTLEEKAGQLSGVWAYEVLTDFLFDENKANNRLGMGIGQITRLGGCTSLSPNNAATLGNQIQEYLIGHTRLGIPALIHEESCAGYLIRDASIFPQALGVAATFDPSIGRQMGTYIREQMMAVGARQTLAPLMDVTRDPRWGRTEETYGEDPYLVSRMCSEYTSGLQGESQASGVLATGKHFVGYGAGEGGMNWAPAHIGQREMEEVYLYPFEAAVRTAGLLSVMPGYHEVDGIPCHTNKHLLEDILRRKWGFDGLIVSDYFAVRMIHSYHKAAEDAQSAAHMALDAGVDIELPSTDCYGAPLVSAVREGTVPEALVDQSVLRILRIKFALGLFEKPYVDAESAATHFHTKGQNAFALDAAVKSMTLLKNDGLLPLSKSLRRIAVIGPNADSRRNLLGDYSFPAHVESLIDQTQDNFAETPTPESEYSVEDSLPKMPTVLEGLRVKIPQAEIRYAHGCTVLGGTDEQIAEAVEIARQAEVAILVMGDKAGLISDCSSGEARDRTTLTLPGRQLELVQAIHQTGTPVVLVLVNGRPFSLGWEDAHLPAILEAWLPGEAGAHTIADVLFGDANPAGRLPITFPRSAGQVPTFYAHRPSGGRSHWKGAYVDESNRPLYPFGHGLSYAAFDYYNFCLPNATPIGGEIVCSVSITNVSEREGEEVVQLYIQDLIANDVTRPVKELKAFLRVRLAPHETRTVRFTVHTRQLAFLNRAMSFVVEPGEHLVMIGASSSDIRTQGIITLTGDVCDVTDKVFCSQAEII